MVACAALRHDAQRRQQLRALLAARDAHGNTVLAVLLKNRNASGYNAEAWARTAVGLLRKISPDVPDHVAWLNVCGTATPLMMLVFRKLSGDAPQLALVAACLVYGCDATIVTAVRGRAALRLPCSALRSDGANGVGASASTGAPLAQRTPRRSATTNPTSSRCCALPRKWVASSLCTSACFTRRIVWSSVMSGSLWPLCRR